MSSYSWPIFPVHGTSNFEPTARAALEGWRTNGAAMEVRVNELESGAFFAGLSSPIIPSAAIISIDASLLSDGTVPVGKLEVDGTVSDGAALIYRDASSGWTLEPISGVVGGDTYQVKFSAADTPEYLESKVATDSALIAGTSDTAIVTPNGLKLGNITASMNSLGVVSGTVSISPTHGVHVLELGGDTTLSFTGFDTASVHYTIMVIITNTSYSLTWANTITPTVGGMPTLESGRFRLLLSTYDGGSTFDISEVTEYAV